MSESQIFKIVLSRAQRFLILDLCHRPDQKIPDGQEGRRYRRFMRAFGLSDVARIMREFGSVATKTIRDENTVHTFEVTSENVEYALKVLSGTRTPLFEDVCGELMDELEALRRGEKVEIPEAPAYDPDADNIDWIPEGEKDEGG